MCIVSQSTQGINESANFRFLQRLSVIFGFCRDCHLLLPAETLGRKLNHTDSLCRKLFSKHNSLGRRQEIADSLGGSKYAGSENWRTRLYPVIKTAEKIIRGHRM